MEKSISHVYFAISGDDFDPEKVTELIGIKPTEAWRKGDKGRYISISKNSTWQLSTEKGREYFNIDNLVNEVVDKLFDKIEIINSLKSQLHLDSNLEIVLDVDINPEKTTPSLGHNLKVIEFLYKTKTTTDVDIYRFDSSEEKE